MILHLIEALKSAKVLLLGNVMVYMIGFMPLMDIILKLLQIGLAATLLFITWWNFMHIKKIPITPERGKRLSDRLVDAFIPFFKTKLGRILGLGMAFVLLLALIAPEKVVEIITAIGGIANIFN